MSIFSAIGDLLRPSRPHATSEKFQLPYGLTNEEWVKLRSLTRDPGWEVFLKSLDAITKLSGEQLLQSSKDEALHFLRGKIVGIRKAASLVDEISMMEKRFVNERKEHESRNERERGRGVLYGSPGWRGQSNSRDDA